jgi:hypothetical protein
MPQDHRLGGLALGHAVRFRHGGLDHEPAAVLHQRMSHEAELDFLAGALAVQLREARSRCSTFAFGTYPWPRH